MRKMKKMLSILSFLLSFSLILSGCAPLSNHPETEPELSETESEIYSEIETEYIGTEESTEESTEVLIIPEDQPLSYNEQIKLNFVPKPERRNREEAIARIKELARWYPAFYFIYENADQYPTELLLSGAGNPEMASYLYDYLDSEPVVTGGFTEEEQPENYPLFLQYDPRWGYMLYGTEGNMGSSGCGPTSLSMAVFYLTGDRSCTPDAVARYSLNAGHYVQGIGTSWNLLTEYPRYMGLSSYKISWSEENLKANLDNGRILVCSVRLGHFTSSGHFIVIYGYDENGFKINDPKCVYRSDLRWTYEQIQNDFKAIWSIGK